MTQGIPDYPAESKREDRRWSAIGALAVIAVLQAFAIGVLLLQQHDESIRSRGQSEQLAKLMEADERRSSEADHRLERALAEVNIVMEELFAQHHEDSALKLNDLLHRIAALLERPAGTPPNPVNAVSPSSGRSAPAPAPSASPRAAPRAAPTATTPARTSTVATTTTTPDQRSCVKRPSGPRC